MANDYGAGSGTGGGSGHGAGARGVFFGCRLGVAVAWSGTRVCLFWGGCGVSRVLSLRMTRNAMGKGASGEQKRWKS